MNNGADAGTSLVGLFVWIIIIGWFIARRRAKHATPPKAPGAPAGIGAPPTSSPGGWRYTGWAAGDSSAGGYDTSADPGTSAADNRRGGDSSDDGSKSSSSDDGYYGFYPAYDDSGSHHGSGSHYDSGSHHGSGSHYDSGSHHGSGSHYDSDSHQDSGSHYDSGHYH